MSKISQELVDLGFFSKFEQTSDMTSCNVYKRISHILLISSLICPFFFPINKTVIASEGYRRGYVSFDHC